MNFSFFRHGALVTSILFLCCPPLFATGIDELSPNAHAEKWGQVLLCQRIYKMDEVKPRMYEFDTEQCDKSEKLMNGMLAKYTAMEQLALKFKAENHAKALTYNTSEPYHSVPACRELCSELAEIYDQRNPR